MFKGVILYLNRMPQKVVPDYKVMFFTFIIIKNMGYLILRNEENFVQKTNAVQQFLVNIHLTVLYFGSCITMGYVSGTVIVIDFLPFVLNCHDCLAGTGKVARLKHTFFSYIRFPLSLDCVLFWL